MTTINNETILNETVVRRHNGQCEYGEWIDLTDAPHAVQEAVVDAILDALTRDMRREPSVAGNTDGEGYVTVGGQTWRYDR